MRLTLHHRHQRLKTKRQQNQRLKTMHARFDPVPQNLLQSSNLAHPSRERERERKRERERERGGGGGERERGERGGEREYVVRYKSVTNEITQHAISFTLFVTLVIFGTPLHDLWQAKQGPQMRYCLWAPECVETPLSRPPTSVLHGPEI